MNKYFLSAALAATILSAGAVSAQLPEKGDAPRPRHEMDLRNFDKAHHAKMAKKMAEDLKLTEDQIKQAEKIRQDGREKLKPLMDQMRELHKKIEQERKANMDEFEKILTPEQKKIFDEQKQNMPKKFFPRGEKSEARKMMRGSHQNQPQKQAPHADTPVSK